MPYAGSVCLLLCSLTVVFLAATLPFVTAGLRERQRTPIPLWATGTAILLLVIAALGLRSGTATNDQVSRAVTLAALTIGGILLKWLLDLAARKPRAVRENTLAKALLFAPLAPLCFGAIFAAHALTGTLVLLWFANGFFWQTLCGDLERMNEKERVVILRREPPQPTPPWVGTGGPPVRS